MISHQFEPVFL